MRRETGRGEAYAGVDEAFVLAAVLVDEVEGVAGELVASGATGLDELGAASVW